MAIVYRICKAKHRAIAFSGEGARLEGGRWNEPGTRLVYCAGTVSLGMLELLVHSAELPKTMVCINLTIPDDVRLDAWSSDDLPPDWADYPGPAALQARGSGWVRSGAALGVWVPSAVVQNERNLLINPSHADWSRCSVSSPTRLAFDTRLRPP